MNKITFYSTFCKNDFAQGLFKALQGNISIANRYADRVFLASRGDTFFVLNIHPTTKDETTDYCYKLTFIVEDLKVDWWCIPDEYDFFKMKLQFFIRYPYTKRGKKVGEWLENLIGCEVTDD